MSGLPWFVRWLLNRCLPDPDREFVLGDLEEAFQARRASPGARRWLWGQVFALTWSRGPATVGRTMVKTMTEDIRNGARLLTADGIHQDLRLALRVLAKDRSFTLGILLTLAIVIGANAAMFGIVRSIILKPLPFPGADRLVVLYNSYPNAGSPRGGASVPNYFDRQAAMPALDRFALYQRGERRLGDAQGVERIASLRTTPSLLEMLSVKPVQGRLFTEDESQPGHNNFVLLGHGLWQRKFGGASVINQTIRLNEASTVVVGVLPPGFSFLGNDIDIVEPLAFNASARADNQRFADRYQMVGRLAEGATRAQAQAQVDAINVSVLERFPQFRQRLTEAGFRTVVAPLKDEFVSGVRSMLYLLWGGVAFILLIGCVNVANLVIVRAAGRTREMATRHAIGADLSQLARQVVTESVVLALAGGVLGIALGALALGSIEAVGLDQLPRAFEIGLDPVAAVTILGVTVVIGVVLGLLPVARLHRMNLGVELREESRAGTAGRRTSMFRGVLATAQFAIAFVVLAGAGLLFASFRAAIRVDLGFQPANVATVTVELPTDYRNRTAQMLYVRRTLKALRATPDVEAAGGTTLIPFSGGANRNPIVGEGQAETGREALLVPSQVTVTGGYFRAMGVPIVAGRDFDSRDTDEAPLVAVIDERVAQTLWPGQDAVGRRLFLPDSPDDFAKVTPNTRFFTVIGVVKPMRVLQPQNGETPFGTVYYPYDQRLNTTFNFVVKARAEADITTLMRGVMARNDPTVPTYGTRSMQDWIERALVGRRAPMVVAVIFAAVSLLLSAIGVYGVIAHGVAQRQRELGIRMALGGTAARIFALILGNGLRIVAVGLILGVAGAYVVGQLMTSLLFSVAPTSGLVLILAAGALSVVAIAASVLPAWRASRIDPIEVLNR